MILHEVNLIYQVMITLGAFIRHLFENNEPPNNNKKNYLARLFIVQTFYYFAIIYQKT